MRCFAAAGPRRPPGMRSAYSVRNGLCARLYNMKIRQRTSKIPRSFRKLSASVLKRRGKLMIRKRLYVNFPCRARSPPPSIPPLANNLRRPPLCRPVQGLGGRQGQRVRSRAARVSRPARHRRLRPARPRRGRRCASWLGRPDPAARRVLPLDRHRRDRPLQPDDDRPQRRADADAGNGAAVEARQRAAQDEQRDEPARLPAGKIPCRMGAPARAPASARSR